MHKKLLLCGILSLLFSSVLTFSATAAVTWEKTFGGSDWDEVEAGQRYEETGAVEQTEDGGYIIVASTLSFGAGYYDVYLIKTDANGNETWSNPFGGTGLDAGHDVQQTKDGGYIIVGETESFGQGSLFEPDVYLIKTDANGNETWSNGFGTPNQDVGYSVQQTKDGGYIIVGETEIFEGTQSSDFNVLLLKTDANGNEIWRKTFGGTDFDLGKSVQETSNGGYIIVGRTWSFGAGESDFYLIKTDANGNETWSKTFGGTDIERGQSVQETADGGYIITGRTWSFGGGSADVYLIKTDTNGNKTWSKTFGGTDWESGNSVQETADGGYIIAGETCPCPEGTGDVYLIKTDANGNEIWSKTFGGTGQDMGTSVQEIADGEYIIAGDTNSFGNGGFDVYLIYYSVAQRAMPWIPLLLLDD